MVQQLGINSLHNFLHPLERFLNPRPRAGIIIQNPIQNLTQAPIRISFDSIQLLLCDTLKVLGSVKDVNINFSIVRQKNNNEGGDNIINALNIPTGRMPHMPNVQQPTWVIFRYLFMIFFIRSCRNKLLSGSVLRTSSLISFDIFRSCASCSRVGC